MKLLRAEAIKLHSVRTTWAMLGAGLAVEALFAGLFVGLVKPGEVGPVTDVITGTGLLMLLVLVLGVLAITGEFRHGTAATTFLGTPRRYPVLAAKAGVALGAGLLAGLAFVLVNAALALPLYAERVGELPPGGELSSTYAGIAVSFALLCAFGLGVGSILRNQVGGIVAALAFFFVISPLVELVSGGLAEYFPAQAIGALHGLEGEGLSQVGGGLVLAAWTTALLLAGTVLTLCRDLTE